MENVGVVWGTGAVMRLRATAAGIRDYPEGCLSVHFGEHELHDSLLRMP